MNREVDTLVTASRAAATLRTIDRYVKVIVSVVVGSTSALTIVPRENDRLRPFGARRGVRLPDTVTSGDDVSARTKPT